MAQNLDLNRLTSHPSYARSISSEIGRQTGNEGAVKSKPKRKSSNKEEHFIFDELDDLIGSDLSDVSDISEYYSAEEEFGQLNITDTSQVESCQSGDPVFCDLEKPTDNAPSERSRKLSKKQKRKRRQLRSKIFEEFIPFQDVDDLDFEVEDFTDDVMSSAENIQKQLPSLVELCLCNLTSSQSMMGFDLLPPKIKDIILTWKRRQLFSSVQYNWLNRILSDGESDFSRLNTYHLYVDNNDYENDTGQWVYGYKQRNVWSMQQNSEDQCNGSESTKYLNHAVNQEYVETFSPHTGNNGNLCQIYKFNLLSVLCSVIEITIQQLSEKKSRVSPGTDILDQKLYIAKKILSKKYPQIVKYMFDDAVPYIFWSHGNKLAGTHFLDVAKNTQEDVKRQALLLSEAARFYTYMNDTDLSKKFHLQASDVMIGSCRDPDDAKIQMLMLLANLYDQGLMTNEKSRKSLDSWRYIVQTAPSTIFYGTWLEAIESFLCYHCGVWADGDISQLEEGLKFLEILVEKHPKLNLHKSLVQSMLGQESYPAFLAYAASSTMSVIPGKQFFSKENNPWRVIIKSEPKPKLLNVIWRTQLKFMYPIINENVPHIADVQGNNLNFRLSNHGHLTGDFQMLLPPLKIIEMDLYTGQQIFLPGSSVANTWFYSDFNTMGCPNTFYNPTMTEVYNYQGNVVNILNVSTIRCLDQLPDVLHQVKDGLSYIYWTNGNHDSARLNILRLYKKKLREYVLLEINKGTPKNMKGNKDWAEEMRESLEYLYQREGMFDYDSVVNFKKRWSDHRKKEKKAKDSKKAVKKLTFKMFPNQIWKYFRYGHTLVMFLAFTEVESSPVFIDCSSKETFLNPVIEFSYSYRNLNLKVPCIEQVLPRTNSFLIHGSNNNNSTWLVYGQEGEILWKFGPLGGGLNQFQCLNDRFYGSYSSGILCVRDTATKEEELIDGYGTVLDFFIMAYRLLLHLRDQLIILNPDTLKPETIDISCSSISLPISAKEGTIDGTYKAIMVISDTQIKQDNDVYTRLVLAIDSHLVIFNIDEINGGNMKLVMCLEVVGHPTEYHYISRNCGFLLSATLHYKQSEEYREHLYYYNHVGQMKGILPFLGPGPRDMFTVYLKGDEKTNNKSSRLRQPGWYLYLRDGHGGIMAVLLERY